MESRRVKAAANMLNFLLDISFPATKDDILAHADDHGVTEDIYGRLEQLPDKEYQSLAEVVDAMAV